MDLFLKRDGDEKIEVAVKSYNTSKGSLDYEKAMEEVRILRRIRKVKHVSKLLRVYESLDHLHIVTNLVKSAESLDDLIY